MRRRRTGGKLVGMIRTCFAAALCALTLVASAAAAVSVSRSVDRQAPTGALPHQTFRVSGLVSHARYRLAYRLRGRRQAGCETFGSSIVVTAFHSRATFADLPSGSYDGGFYSGFCAGRHYAARIVRVLPARGVTIKHFEIVGAPASTGPQPTATQTPTAPDDSGAAVTFSVDPDAPSGSVPHEIAHITGLTPGRSYGLELNNRTPGTDCFNSGAAGGQIVGDAGAYDAPLPLPIYAAGYNLCPGATYDVALGRYDDPDTPTVLLRTSFTAPGVKP